MTTSFPHRVGRFGLVVGCTVLISSCSRFRFHAPTDPASGAHAGPPARIAQLDFGRSAVFARCVPPACPMRTPKTLTTNKHKQPSHDAAALAPDESIAPDPVATNPAPKTVTTRAVTVQFAFGSTRLNSSAQARLDDVIADITTAYSVTITGRTDSTGPLAVNEALALTRAHAVRDHLLKAHPALSSVLTVQAHGPCCFIAPNDTLAGRAQNRRAEVVFQVEDRP